tara:strand:- start:2248 stop:2538 length:291 start_codon:yes stop_codon:yes gene_type:complete
MKHINTDYNTYTLNLEITRIPIMIKTTNTNSQDVTIVNTDPYTEALFKKLLYDNDASTTTEVTNFNPMYETRFMKGDTPTSPKEGLQQVSKPSLKL